MRPRKPFRKTLKSLCGQVGPGDGEDPRFDRESRRSGTRKAKQLCSQVSIAIQYALAESPDDEFLTALWVVSVEPAPDVTRLMVTVSSTEGLSCDPAVILESLEFATGRLRSAVAGSVTRRRVPSLSFRLAPG